MVKFKKYKSLFVAVLIPLILFGAFNVAANGHLHQLDTGELVYHAHPFTPNPADDSPIKNHNHSACDYISLHQITTLLCSAIIVVFLINLINKELKKLNLSRYIIFQISNPHVEVLQHRGPPTL